LIVEDEADIAGMVTFALEEAGFRCDVAVDGEAAWSQLLSAPPDLLLLDWMLPGESGLALARRIRENGGLRHLPIIMLTALGGEEEKVMALESGADDYLTKPFSPKELVARIRAVLRRSRPESDERAIRIGPLLLDPAGHRLAVAGEEVHLGPTEFRLLHLFMRHPGRVFSRTQILDRVWGRQVYVEERTVDVHIRRLRAALSSAGTDRWIQTVRGAGYRFSPGP